MTMPKIAKPARGFTLLELMIVLVIVGIFAAIAIPAYSKYVQRTHRALARAALTELSARQDVERLQKRAFATTFEALNGVSSSTIYINNSSAASSTAGTDALYKISFASGASTTAYTLIAEPYGDAQSKDTDCAKLTLSSTGVRTAEKSNGNANSDCWGN